MFNSAQNTGIAFGLLKGYNNLLISIIIVIILILGYFYWKNTKLRLAFSFIIAGAVSNLIDRVLNGYIIDFIKIFFWPAFNLADIFIAIGAVLLVYMLQKKY